MAEPFRHVDLCSGIGGFALGFQWAGLSEPVLFCDIEAWSRQILAKHWPDVPIAEDVKELASDPERLVPDCDILTAGYPCQPFSQAGVRRGEEDDRHIWPEIFTIVQAKRPAWCVFENVSGHISLGLDQVLSDLESKGYAVQPFVVPACAVDAPHRRDRVWIVANSDDAGQPASAGPRQNNRDQPWDDTRRRSADVGDTDGGDRSRHNKATDQGWRQQGLATGCEDVADANSDGRQQMSHWESGQASRGRKQIHEQEWDADSTQETYVFDADSVRCEGSASQQVSGFRKESRESVGTSADQPHLWTVEPPVGRVANGIPRRVDRLKGLGNAIVPQIAMQIGLTIKAVEHG